MPRKRCPFAPLAPLAPLTPLVLAPRLRIKLNLTTNTLRPSNIPFIFIFTLTPCPKIDVLKSKKPKIGKLEIKLTPTLTPPLPPVKTISYSIEFRIYLDEVKRIMQAFLINLLVRVCKTG
jgi:hypothetical protein